MLVSLFEQVPVSFMTVVVVSSSLFKQFKSPPFAILTQSQYAMIAIGIWVAWRMRYGLLQALVCFLVFVELSVSHGPV